MLTNLLNHLSQNQQEVFFILSLVIGMLAFCWVCMMFTRIRPTIERDRSMTLEQHLEHMNGVIDNAETFTDLNCLAALKADFKTEYRKKMSGEQMEYHLRLIDDAKHQRVQDIVRENNQRVFRKSKKLSQVGG